MRPGIPARPARPRGRWLVLALLQALPAGAHLASAAPQSAAMVPEGRALVDPELQRQQSEIVAAFVAGDADRVAGLLSPRLKTYVACPAVAREDGYYGADQLRLLLRRLFRGRESAGFRVVTPVSKRQDGQAVLQAIWSYRESGATGAQMHLAFTLAREAGAWRLREIRDLS